MQPKKGPSWANEDAVPGPSSQQPPPRTADTIQDEEMVEDFQSDEESKPDAASDMDWLRRHTKSALTLESDDKVFEQSDSESGEPDEPQAAVRLACSFFCHHYSPFYSQTNRELPPSDPNKAAILETSRLFLRNLAFSCTEDELLQLFTPYGTVSQVRIIPVSVE